MESPAFVKLLHCFFPDPGCGTLVFRNTFNTTTECTYRVATAATQLHFQDPDVFRTLSGLGLRFFLGIGPWGVHPELVNEFLAGYDHRTATVIMQAFKDAAPIEFQFTVADIRDTLHLPSDGLPFRTTKSPCVVPHIIPEAYKQYKGREGWRFTEIPLHLHDKCSAIAQIGDTASHDVTSRVAGEFVKWAHNPQPVDWAEEFHRRVREWQARPKPAVNFAWFLTRYLCAKFKIGPPAPRLHVARSVIASSSRHHLVPMTLLHVSESRSASSFARYTRVSEHGLPTTANPL